MDFLRVLFSKNGLFIVIYVIIGVFINTAPPHFPSGLSANFASLHGLVQYFVSVFFWPLSFWHPAFTVAKWTP